MKGIASERARTVESSHATGRRRRTGKIDLAYTLTADEPLEQIPLHDANSLPLRELRPVRRPSFYRWQKRNPGWYFATTTSGHVPYESRLELANLILADFDPRVEWIVSQPFRLHWREEGAPRSHVPDFLLLHRGGEPRILNVSVPEKTNEDKANKFRVCGVAARRLGWQAEVVGAPDRILLANLRLLAGARRDHVGVDRYRGPILAAVGEERRLADIESDVEPKALVRPTLLHLLWHSELEADLHQPLSGATLIRRAERRPE